MLRSVYVQLWDNLEVIIVNDGSTDGTREIISDWEPKLRRRGFEVVIIDQDNQGVAAAVYNGMKTMSGEFFCSVDCDDELHPEYVSKMAQHLNQHANCDWVACNYFEVRNGLNEVSSRKINKPINSMLHYMLMKGHASVWPHLIRTSYLKKCRVLDNFDADARITQEPQIMVPLLCGGGKQDSIDDCLYYYNISGGNLWSRTPEKREQFFSDYFELVKSALKTSDLDPKSRNTFLRYAELCKKILLVPRASLHRRKELLSEICQMVKNKVVLSYWCKSYDISNRWAWMISYALTDWVLSETECAFELNNYDRIIAYGALGKNAKKYLGYLIKVLSNPPLLWDINSNGEVLFGLPCTKPKFSEISGNEAIILFPQDPKIAKWVAAQINIDTTLIEYQKAIESIRNCLFPVPDGELLKLDED